MRTKGFNVIMTSAYVSAMILSGLSQVRSSIVLASALDPQLPQRAISSIVSGLNAAGMAAGISNSSIASPKAREVAYSASSSVRPCLTPNELGKLRQRAMAAEKTWDIPGQVVGLFGLETSPTPLPSKQLASTRSDGKYYVAFSLKAGTDDVFFTVRTEGAVYIYLTDSTTQLRAAAVIDGSGARLITNEQAAPGYQAPLRTWAELAAGVAVASNNS